MHLLGEERGERYPRDASSESFGIERSISEWSISLGWAIVEELGKHFLRAFS